MNIEKNIEDINTAIENYFHKQDERFGIGLLSGSMGVSVCFIIEVNGCVKKRAVAEKLYESGKLKMKSIDNFIGQKR